MYSLLLRFSNRIYMLPLVLCLGMRVCYGGNQWQQTAGRRTYLGQASPHHHLTVFRRVKET